MEQDQPASQPVSQPVSQVEVRRNVVLSAVVGALAAGLAVAFAVRATSDGALLDWVALAVLGVIAAVYAAALVDGRAPLLVADDQGVRLREGSRWLGLAWPDIECLEHLPPRPPLRDGHLLVVGDDGQQLLVPLTLATRVVGADRAALSDVLAELAAGRADVVEVVPGLAEEPPATGDDAAEQAPLDAGARDADAVKEDVAPADVAPEDAAAEDAAAGDEGDADTGEIRRVSGDEPATDELAAVPSVPPAPGRAPVAAVRVERPAEVRSVLAAAPARPAATPDAEETVVLDDLVLRPAPDPVIGPELAAARERLRLTVDQLSERTRIRPHVIEAVEVDDFGPCGGDFYARGHLRTLARVLGVEAAPLLASYDERYADAPVDPRRVFEAELATGSGGSIRGTRGGRNWSVLVAAVMAAVLVWSIARLVMDGPVPIGDTPVLNQSGGISGARTKVAAVPVTLTAAGGGAKVVVRDGGGDIVLDGELAFGQTSELEVVPPVRIWSSDGSVTVSLDGEPAEALGETGDEVTTTLTAP